MFHLKFYNSEAPDEDCSLQFLLLCLSCQEELLFVIFNSGTVCSFTELFENNKKKYLKFSCTHVNYNWPSNPNIKL